MHRDLKPLLLLPVVLPLESRLGPGASGNVRRGMSTVILTCDSALWLLPPGPGDEQAAFSRFLGEWGHRRQEAVGFLEAVAESPEMTAVWIKCHGAGRGKCFADEMEGI